MNKTTPTPIEDISPFHGEFGRIKMIIYGAILPYFTLFLLLSSQYTEDVASFLNIGVVLIIIGVPLIMILYSVFRRSIDIGENPYFYIAILLIPVLNLYFIMDLFLTKGKYSDYGHIEEEWYGNLEDE